MSVLIKIAVMLSLNSIGISIALMVYDTLNGKGITSYTNEKKEIKDDTTRKI
jgi:hypothetical protein